MKGIYSVDYLVDIFGETYLENHYIFLKGCICSKDKIEELSEKVRNELGLPNIIVTKIELTKEIRD